MFIAAVERIGTRSLWLNAAKAIAADGFEDAADLLAEIGAAPDEALARLRAAQQHIKDGRRA